MITIKRIISFLLCFTMFFTLISFIHNDYEVFANDLSKDLPVQEIITKEDLLRNPLEYYIEENSLVGGLISGGLAIASSQVMATALTALAIGFGVTVSSYALINSINYFIANEEYIADNIQVATNGLIAVSSSLVSKFKAFLNERFQSQKSEVTSAPISGTFKVEDLYNMIGENIIEYPGTHDLTFTYIGAFDEVQYTTTCKATSFKLKKRSSDYNFNIYTADGAVRGDRAYGSRTLVIPLGGVLSTFPNADTYDENQMIVLPGDKDYDENRGDLVINPGSITSLPSQVIGGISYPKDGTTISVPDVIGGAGILKPEGTVDVLPEVDIPDTDIPDTDIGDTSFPVAGEGELGLLGSIFEGLRAIWQLIKDIIKSILSIPSLIIEGIRGLLEWLVNALKELLILLFSPTVSLELLFPKPSGGFADIIDLFNFDRLFSITPTPYKFETNLGFKNLVNNSTIGYPLVIDIGNNAIVTKYIDLIRNLMSYSLLITNVYFVLFHFLPKRDMD